MDNLETLGILSIQDAGRRQKKPKTENKTQHRKLKRLPTQSQPKTGMNPGAREG